MKSNLHIKISVIPPHIEIKQKEIVKTRRISAPVEHYTTKSVQHQFMPSCTYSSAFVTSNFKLK